MESRDDIFLAARELTVPEERAAYLARACGSDAALRAEVEGMLRDAEEADAFFGPGQSRKTQAWAPASEKPGQWIGRYKLLEEIGEGGCGVVYVAGQEEPVRRRVALKVVKWGMDTRQVIARFEAERQALAMMDHPSIAKVFDAGATETGRPYFVMELVRGVRMTDYCDQNRLSTEERLKLFVQVCHAVQHAHQKGVIHRDIKPSNILVMVADDVPVPKPSTRLSRLEQREQTTTAQRRATEAPKLIRSLRGDLDWIVMRCLEKNRTRRYETANELAQDIECHLTGFGGTGALDVRPVIDGLNRANLDRFTKSSRAWVMPVVHWTWGRQMVPPLEDAISLVKDLKRTLDYLETRPEVFDTNKLAYFGASWGGIWAGIVPAVEPRIKVAIVSEGGVYPEYPPEFSQINFTPRIKIPILLQGGKYDSFFTIESGQKPYLTLFGTPENDKHYKLYETGHHVWSKNECGKDVLDFLDEYFGPPNSGTREPTDAHEIDRLE